MKVYVFFKEQVYEYDLLSQDVEVFLKKEDAEKAFMDFVEDEKGWLKGKKGEEWEIEESENHFEAYEWGSFPKNHTIAWINQEIVK